MVKTRGLWVCSLMNGACCIATLPPSAYYLPKATRPSALKEGAPTLSWTLERMIMLKVDTDATSTSAAVLNASPPV